MAIVARLEYNARGQRVRCLLGNQVRTTYAYDPQTFRLIRLRTRRGDEALQDLSYTFDPVGNISRIRDDAQQTLYFRNRRVEPSASYRYDALYQLVEATGREHLGQVAGRPPAGPPGTRDAERTGLPQPGDGQAMSRYTERYRYDEAGNILAMAHRSDQPGHPGWTRTFRYEQPSALCPDERSNRLTSSGVDSAGRPGRSPTTRPATSPPCRN